MTEVPCIFVEDLTEEQKRAYIINGAYERCANGKEDKHIRYTQQRRSNSRSVFGRVLQREKGTQRESSNC